MAFPTSPTDGQQATVNNIVYNYNSGNNTWTRYSTGFVDIGASGNVSAVGNVIGNYIIGNGSLLTNINAGNITGLYGNANVAAYLPTYTGNTAAGNISVTGNITGSRFIGNGSTLTSINGSNVTGAVSSATTATSATTAATVTTNAQPNITSVGTLTTLSVSGNITAGNISVTGNLAAPTAANGTNSTQVATTAFVQAAVTASGGYGNAQVAVYLPTYTGNLVSLTGPVTTTANVTANNFVGSGNLNLSASSGNATQVIGGGTFRLPSFTTAQLGNITGVPGDMVYNSDLNIVQAYQMNPATSTMGWVGWTVAVYQ